MDYRVERLFIRLSDPIPNADPSTAVDPEEFAWHVTDFDANHLGLRPLTEFYAAEFHDWSEDDKWFPAREGLETVRGLLGHYRRILAEGHDPLGRQMDVIQDKVRLLEPVERVLAVAAERSIDFCLVATS